MDPFPSPARSWRFWVAPAAAVALALLVRLPAILGAGFPLGDGGMFAAIIDDIRAGHGALPSFTSFNGGTIPLCYPPLGFYLAVLSGLPTLAALCWLPLMFSALVPGAVVLLGRQLLRSESAATWAGVTAALLPIPMWYGLEGGGLTRSLGLLGLVLAIAAVAWVAVAPTLQRAVLAGLAVGLTALSHPEAALLVAVLAPLTLILAGWRRPFLRPALVAGGVAAAVVAPWLALVLARHGLAPWLAAFGSADGAAGLATAAARVVRLTWWGTAEPGWRVFGVLALLGAPVAIIRGRGLPLALAIIPTYLTARVYRYWAAPGLALLVGLAVGCVLWPAIARAMRAPASAALARAAIGLLIVAHGLLLAQRWQGSVAYLQPLAAEDREVLTYLAHQARPGDGAAVIGEAAIGTDQLAEWAPYLAGVSSPIVPQGREWLGDAAAAETRAEDLHRALLAGGDSLRAFLVADRSVRWLMVGSATGQDERVIRSLTAFGDSGAGQLVCQRGAATVWRVR